MIKKYVMQIIVTYEHILVRIISWYLLIIIFFLLSFDRMAFSVYGGRSTTSPRNYSPGGDSVFQKTLSLATEMKDFYFAGTDGEWAERSSGSTKDRVSATTQTKHNTLQYQHETCSLLSEYTSGNKQDLNYPEYQHAWRQEKSWKLTVHHHSFPSSHSY